MSSETRTKELCAKLMPRAKEPCAKAKGHRGDCLTAYAVESNKRYPAHWRVPA